MEQQPVQIHGVVNILYMSKRLNVLRGGGIKEGQEWLERMNASSAGYELVISDHLAGL